MQEHRINSAGCISVFICLHVYVTMLKEQETMNLEWSGGEEHEVTRTLRRRGMV